MAKSKSKHRRGPSSHDAKQPQAGRRPSPTAEPPPGRKALLILLPVIATAGLLIALALYQRSHSQDSAGGSANSSVLQGESGPALGTSSGAARGFNVVLITLDTTRADRVGCYGNAAIETPALDALAAGGVRFADAVTCVPITLPAHASIMTGDYPPTHGVRDNGTYRLPPEQVTLAERLHEAGYATAAFIAAFVLDRRYGLDQGFDVYGDDITLAHRPVHDLRADPQRPGDEVMDEALAWLDGQHAAAADKPLFAWIHLYDPHTPYAPPEPYATRYAANPYDGELAFADAQVGRCTGKLRELGLLDRTVMVVVGDHGEGLGEHGESTHSLLIYEATLHVPFLWHCPGVIPAGQVIDDRVVSVVDMEPTLLDLLGIEAGSSDGVSLLRPPAAGAGDRAVYVETMSPRFNHGWAPLYGLRRHQDKFIEAPTQEYYDLTADAAERSNLRMVRADEANELQDRLKALMVSFPQSASDAAAAAPDREAVQKLQALGYVGGAVLNPSGPLPDPKVMIAQSEHDLARASALVDRGEHREAIPLLKALLNANPADAKLWSLLSFAQAQAGQRHEAIASRMHSIELQPREANAWLHLSRMQRGLGDATAADASLAEAERIEPTHGEVSLLRGRAALEAGRFDEARAEAREARRRDPTRHTATAWALEGAVYDKTGRGDLAQNAYETALAADPREASALYGLASLADRQRHLEKVIEYAGRIARGEPEWAPSRAMLARAYVGLEMADQAVGVVDEWVAAMPGQPWIHNNRGTVFYELHRLNEAAAAYEEAVRLDPKYVMAHRNLARVYESLGKLNGAIEHLRRVLELQPGQTEAATTLAELLNRSGAADQAMEVYAGLIQAGSGDPEVYKSAVTLYVDHALLDRAVETLRWGHKQLPGDADIALELAWRLATADADEVRNGAEAVEVAERARDIPGVDEVRALDVLAAAYAEAGRFDDAVVAAQDAIDAARAAGQTSSAGPIAARLRLYEAHQPYRE